jgi:1,4-alpha-glucan branching enzyme
MLTPVTVFYRVHTMSGYWQTPPGTNVLSDGDGYWFRIEMQDGIKKDCIDPYARAMNNSVSWSIYKDPGLFQWTDAGHRPPKPGEMVIYQLFQGAYMGRGDQPWMDRNGHNCLFTWGATKKGDFVQLRKKLDYIQSLGVNTIELLPVNEFNGNDYIGYASVTWFAIESSCLSG